MTSYFTNAWIAVLTIASLGLLAANASACGGYKSYRPVTVKKVYAPVYVPPTYPAAVPAAEPLPQPALPEASALPSAAALPNVLSGSSFTLAGREIGAERGVVRLKINGLVLPATILEWTSTSVKLELPQIELAAAMPAEIETVRADGTLVANTRVNLVPAAATAAAAN